MCYEAGFLLRAKPGLASAGRGGFRAFAAGRGDAEEFDHVRDIAVAAILQDFLDLLDDVAQFAGGFGIDLFHIVSVLAHDVVVVRAIEVDFVKGGAVVEEAATDEIELFEHGQAAIYGDEIARAVGKIIVQLLDACRLGAFDERIDDGDARLRNA